MKSAPEDWVLNTCWIQLCNYHPKTAGLLQLKVKACGYPPSLWKSIFSLLIRCQACFCVLMGATLCLLEVLVAQRGRRVQEFAWKSKSTQQGFGGLSVRDGCPGKSLPRSSRNTQRRRKIKNIHSFFVSVLVTFLSPNCDVTEQRSGCPDSIWKSKPAAVLKLSAQVMHEHTLTCSTGSHSSALHTCWHPLDIVKHQPELSPDPSDYKAASVQSFHCYPDWKLIGQFPPYLPSDVCLCSAFM